MSKIVIIIAVILIAIFLCPLIVLVAWNCARELWPELPMATYHHAFWITWAFGILFGRGLKTSGKD